MIQAPELSEKSPLANRIKAARHRAGMSQRALAARLGVSAGAVAQWELGSHAPALQKLSKIADALSTSPDELLGRPPAGLISDANVTELALIREARELGVDLHAVVKAARHERWLAENRAALQDANEFLDRHGLWSDGRRQF